MKASKQEYFGELFLKKTRKKWYKWQRVAIECLIKPQTVIDIQKIFGFKDYSDTKILLQTGEKEKWTTSYIENNKRYWYVTKENIKFFIIHGVYRRLKSYRRNNEKNIKLTLDYFFKYGKEKQFRKGLYKELVG